MTKYFILISFVCFSAFAQSTPETFRQPLGTVINDLTLAAARTTSNMDVSGFAFLKLQVRITYAAVTAVSMTCQESEDTTVWSNLTVINGTASTAFNPSQAIAAASLNFTWRLDVAGFKYIRCTFTGATGGATDKITVVAHKQVGE